MENSHIVTSFDKDLKLTESLLLEMGGLVEAILDEATTALVRRDVELSNKVIAADKKIDALEFEINETAVRTIALRQPVADDLRSIMAILKISHSLERIGDYAKNIAKRTHVLAQTEPVGNSTNTVKRMSDLVQEMITQVLDAFVNRDVQTADEIRLRDEDVDLMHNTLFRELLTYMMEDSKNITPCMHLLFIAKNIERAGDHATGIAEQAHYLVTGELPDDDRPKKDITSSIFVAPEIIAKED